MENNRPVQSRIRVQAGQGAPPSVDGHPGWVQQSVRLYVLVFGLALAIHGFMAGAGPVLTNARSAAWWCMALGALCGMLIWLPLWGIMRGQTATSLDEALIKAYGNIAGRLVLGIFALLMFMDALIALHAVGSVVRQYMLFETNEKVIALATLAVVGLSLHRRGIKGLALFIRLILPPLVIGLAGACYCMLKCASLDNIFPLLGNDVGDTLWQIPFAASSFTGLVMLGFLPRQTGSAKPVRFRTGVFTLVIAGSLAVVMTLIINLCVPPRAVPADMFWGHQLMLSAEFMESRAFRLIYVLLLVLSLIVSIGVSLYSGRLMLSTDSNAQTVWPILLMCAALAGALFLPSSFTLLLTHNLVIWRFPVAAVLLWVTWGVLAFKRRGGKAAKA